MARDKREHPRSVRRDIAHDVEQIAVVVKMAAHELRRPRADRRLRRERAVAA